MLYLFGDVAGIVAAKLEFTYDELEEKGIEDYMKLVKGDLLKCSLGEMTKSSENTDMGGI